MKRFYLLTIIIVLVVAVVNVFMRTDLGWEE